MGNSFSSCVASDHDSTIREMELKLKASLVYESACSSPPGPSMTSGEVSRRQSPVPSDNVAEPDSDECQSLPFEKSREKEQQQSDDGSFILFIESSCGYIMFRMRVTSSTTVGKIKVALSKRVGFALRDIRLIFAGKSLADGKTLGDCCIGQEDKLEMVVEQRGGGGISFVDVSKNVLITRKWSKTAPAWRRKRPGLAIEGVCENEDCRAFCNMVIANVIDARKMDGTAKFDLSADANLCRCPVCHAKVRPVKPGFSDCKFRIFGRKSGALGDFERPWTVAPADRYTTFDEDGSGVAEWGVFFILVKPIAV